MSRNTGLGLTTAQTAVTSTKTPKGVEQTPILGVYWSKAGVTSTKTPKGVEQFKHRSGPEHPPPVTSTKTPKGVEQAMILSSAISSGSRDLDQDAQGR